MASPKRKQFRIDGIIIKAPDGYKPVFATTSTEDSVRDQRLILHNTPIGTIAGYDLTWGVLTWEECSTILNSMLNKPSFSFYHKDPTRPNQWITADFYAANYNMEAQTLEEGMEGWTGLSINIRRISPI